MKRWLLFLALLVCFQKAKAEPAVDHERVIRALIARPIFAQLQGQTVKFDASGYLEVNCLVGCSATAGFTDNSAFTVGTTTINPIGAYYTSGAVPSLSTGNAGRVRMDSSSYLFVDCVVGCSGGATTPADAFANPPTAGMSMTFGAGYNGATWDLLRSGDKNNVAGITGVLNTSPVGRYNATQPTLTDTRYNLLQLSSRGELFVSPGVSLFPVQATLAAETTKVIGTVNQGTSPWVISGALTDTQLRATPVPISGTVTVTDGAGALNVIIDSGTLTGALPAGSNVIGHVIADTGSTTAVTGNVTAVQPTASNFNATVVGTGTFATQGTDSVTGNAASGAADSGNPVKMGCVNNSSPTLTPLSLATGQRGDCQIDQFGRILVVDPNDASLIAGLNAVALAQANYRLRGTFNVPLGSIGDALKVTPVLTDPCAGVKVSIPISQTANTRYVIGAGHRTVICSIFIVGADAENVSLVEGVGTVCATGTTAIIGGATAAAGPNMAANGGFSFGNGGGMIAAVGVSGDDVCLFESGSGRVAGVMTVAFGQ